MNCQNFNSLLSTGTFLYPLPPTPSKPQLSHICRKFSNSTSSYESFSNTYKHPGTQRPDNKFFLLLSSVISSKVSRYEFVLTINSAFYNFFQPAKYIYWPPELCFDPDTTLFKSNFTFWFPYLQLPNRGDLKHKIPSLYQPLFLYILWLRKWILTTVTKIARDVQCNIIIARLNAKSIDTKNTSENEGEDDPLLFLKFPSIERDSY